ncbi:MAG: glucose-1-phosphate cytidylyltransferase [Pseudomonadota bacterium]
MKVVILAGGFGSRLSEETEVKPKPMVEVGGRPILWHIMKIYAQQGFSDFLVLLGYKGYVIKEYFVNYVLHEADLTVDLAANRLDVHASSCEPWRVTLAETGLTTLTGGRIKRARPHLGDETFRLTYGDGVADVDLAALLAFHRGHGRACTLTAVQPSGRFGALTLAGDGRITQFCEKAQEDTAWVNGGFFVCEPSVFDYIAGDDTVWEDQPLCRLAADGELFSYQHHGFWKCMDTMREKLELNQLWESGQARWKIWD